MSDPAQKRAVRNYRRRLTQRGIARFEVQALEVDRELIRALARRLAGEGPAATEARDKVRQIVGVDAPRSRILQALRRSPLVGEEFNLSRSRENGRKIKL
jgi:hypothetical protein